MLCTVKVLYFENNCLVVCLFQSNVRQLIFLKHVCQLLVVYIFILHDTFVQVLFSFTVPSFGNARVRCTHMFYAKDPS